MATACPQNTIDAGSIASGSFTGNAMSGDRTNPGWLLEHLRAPPVRHRWQRKYFSWVDDGVGVLGGAHQRQQQPHLSGDMNGDMAPPTTPTSRDVPMNFGSSS
jgi:hypothetical protein